MGWHSGCTDWMAGATDAGGVALLLALACMVAWVGWRVGAALGQRVLARRGRSIPAMRSEHSPGCA